MKYITPLLLLGMMYCSAPSTPTHTTVILIDPTWFLWQTEEYTGYKVGYIRTFGELEVTATLHNTGAGTATDIRLLVALCDIQGGELCSGKAWITPRLEAGVKYSFVVKYKFEYVKQVRVEVVNLDLEWR